MATGGDDALVAHHAAGAGHDELVLEAAQRAAPRALDEGSPRRALSLAEAGLIRAPADETLLAIAAQECWQLGLRHEARDHAEALLARSARSGDPGGEAIALGSLIRLSWESGAEEERHHWVQRLERVVDRLGDHPGRAKALVQLAQTAMLTGDSETAVARADEALALAEAVGDRRVAVQASVERASAMLNRDADSVDACTLLIAAIDDAERLGDVTTMLRAVNNVVHMSTGLLVESDQLLARGIDAAGRLADPAALELLALSLRLRRPLRLGDRQHVRSLLAPAGSRPDHALRQLIDWPVTEVATRFVRADLSAASAS